MAQVLDLRGRQLARDRTPILLDPSGVRARALAWMGRVVAFVFLLWLIGLVFAGLGLLPSGSIPLGRALLGQSPPPVKTMPRITQAQFASPSAAGSVTAAGSAGAAQRAGSGAPGSGSGAGATAASPSTTGAPSGRSHPRTGVGSTSNQGHGQGAGGHPVPGTPGAGSGATSSGTVPTTPAVTPVSNPSNGLQATGSGPGRTVSQSSPGHTKSSGTGSAGKSSSPTAATGNGQQDTTTTTAASSPGKSGSAPGHATVH
jgi:hypothetical protein